jgi:molybdate transport system regulatory protein
MRQRLCSFPCAKVQPSVLRRSRAANSSPHALKALHIFGITITSIHLFRPKTMKHAPVVRFRIDFGEHSNIGPGKVALLEGIKAHGSLAEAARAMGISYRRAWLLIDSVNNSFKMPATVNSAGGRGGGGAEVTAFGNLLIERYREVERKLSVVASEYLKEVRAQVNTEGSASPRRVPVSKKIRKRT